MQPNNAKLTALIRFSTPMSCNYLYKAVQNFLTWPRINARLPREGLPFNGSHSGKATSSPSQVHAASIANCLFYLNSFSF